MASFWLGEKLIPSVVSSIFISFIGIMMIIRPPFLLVFFGLETSNSTLNNPYLAFGLFASLAFSILESLGNVLIRHMSSNVKVTAVVQYVYISGFIFNGCFIVASGKFNTNVYG